MSIKPQVSLRADASCADTSRTTSLPLSEYWELTKPRLSFLSVITALVGYLAANPVRDLGSLLALIFGTSLAAGSAGALNQWLERDVDARMARTRARPLPSGAIKPSHALAYGLSLGVTGTAILALGTNLLATVLTVAIILSYVLVYTPLKPRSAWNTIIGAVPGAMPPLVGWAAATGGVSQLGWILFGLLFCWQIPHFMAIAWTYRKDYREGGLMMSPVVDPSGRDAARQSLLFAAGMLLLSLTPAFLGMVSWWLFTPVAGGLGLWYFLCALRFARTEKRDPAARRLFVASIITLPSMLIVLVLDRLLLAW